MIRQKSEKSTFLVSQGQQMYIQSAANITVNIAVATAENTAANRRGDSEIAAPWGPPVGWPLYEPAGRNGNAVDIEGAIGA